MFNNLGPSSTPVIAPGAENVGHAQILDTLSKPFELEGLFTTADAGAFGGASGDVAMADQDGDVFFDAIEGEAMEEDVWVLISCNLQTSSFTSLL